MSDSYGMGRRVRLRVPQVQLQQQQLQSAAHPTYDRPTRDRKAPVVFNPSDYDRPTRSRVSNGSGGSGGRGSSNVPPTPEVHHRYSTRGNKSAHSPSLDLSGFGLGIGGLGGAGPFANMNINGGGEPSQNGSKDGNGFVDHDALGSDDPLSVPAMYDPPSHPPPDVVAAEEDADSYSMKEEAMESVHHSTTNGTTNGHANGDTDLPNESPYVESPPSDEVGPSTRRRKRKQQIVESDYEEDSADRNSSSPPNRRSTRMSARRSKTSREMKDFVSHSQDEDEDMMEEDGDFRPFRSTRLRDKEERRKAQENLAKRRMREGASVSSANEQKRPAMRATRNSMRHVQDGTYVTGFDDHGKPMTTVEAGVDGVEEEEGEEETEEDFDDDNPPTDGGRKYTLRKKKEVNYTIPALPAHGLDASFEPKNQRTNGFKKAAGKRRRDGDRSIFDGLPMNMSGKQYDRLFGVPPPKGLRDSSDDDMFPSPRKPSIFAGAAGAAGGGQGLFASGFDLNTGAPNNLGKVDNVSNLADTDPLAPAVPPSFESVGGLQNHIQQLKEMVTLPLLYPEVFQQFKITPPRGVLFHGPPGTGKTLMARALAASCTGTNGQKISFFMRKGADCLSKWVGEAERGLRLLFEEARNQQPSIIFFDEIDGLAPVRSSKQEQIHASIVSTLLALMDGMDGRGQVIVIGATNRPDAIDPALRRPGRFDREFYFPLPNREARRTIIDIHTKGWEPPLDDSFKNELAEMTKGYGGADLRALCTEAALNAIQRRYPQLYKTVDRLQIDPTTIKVTARDFVISQKNLIPSTARASSSVSAPLPEQMESLLKPSLEKAKEALAKVLPDIKKVNLLEEAEYEEEVDGGFETEKFRQTFETLRVFRPRLLICGEPGMGQNYVSAAVLHHLEGYHVQSLDLGVLVSDSSRTPEAACVQLFMEAKRHKPSIICIPALCTWASSVTETVRATIKGLLDSLEPADPVLLLGILDGSYSDLPSDIKTWFGFVRGNRLMLEKPSPMQRESFFEGLIAALRRTPIEYPDAYPRKKRVLEELPLAPPPPPRVPSQAEIDAQRQNDARLREYFKWRLGPVLNELKKRYKKFMKPIADENAFVATDGSLGPPVATGDQPIEGGEQVPVRRFHNIDLEQMHYKLYYDQYLTIDDFVGDIIRIRENAELDGDSEYIFKAGQMHNHANIMLDQTFDQNFRTECGKMATREKKRMEEAKEKEKKEGKQSARPTPPLRPSSSRYGTRANGAADLVGFEDIAAVERRLKRARQTDSESPDDQPSKKARSEDASGPAESAVALDQQPATDADATQLESAVGSMSSTLNISDVERTMDVSMEDVAPLSMLQSPAPNGMSLSNLLNPITTPPPGETEPLRATTPVGATAPPVTTPSTPIPKQSVSSLIAAVSSKSPPPPPTKPHTPSPLVNVMVVDNPSPPPVEPEPEPEPLPDFVLDEEKLLLLKRAMVERTEELNVDQLEQLRSMCYSCLWQSRSKWNRNGVLEELQDILDGFVDEVQNL
ncbi:AAA-domain-containing protein [Atractiella rhizophila]|nr:AAA-domain-containing protein [Atractiella rhizophila]